MNTRTAAAKPTLAGGSSRGARPAASVRRSSATSNSRLPSAGQLRTFLQSRVGEPWASVSQALKDTYCQSGLTLEVLLRRADVATRTVVREGKTRVQDELRGLLSLEEAAEHFYVDPASKELRVNEPRLRKEEQDRQRRLQVEREAQARRRDLAPTLQAHKTGERWLVVELAPLEGTAFDAMLSRHVGTTDRAELQRLYGRAGVYARQKRELSYRERQQFQLA